MVSSIYKNRNYKHSASGNEAFYDSQIRFLWLQNHEPDDEEHTVCEKEVK